MDPLSDLLSLLKPRSYITAGFDAGGEWALSLDDLAGRIKCYAVIRGACWDRSSRGSAILFAISSRMWIRPSRAWDMA